MTGPATPVELLQMTDPITIHLGPNETISQALIRACLIAPPGDGPHETITIPPGVHIAGQKIRQTRIIERRTTGIPFLGFGDQP
jgi:hypothetical protein